MEIALYIAVIVVSIALITVVTLQARTAGMQNRDAGSIYRTRRGLEKTLYQTTIILSATFLVLALIVSLPLFGSVPTLAPAPGGFIGLLLF